MTQRSVRKYSRSQVGRVVLLATCVAVAALLLLGPDWVRPVHAPSGLQFDELKVSDDSPLVGRAIKEIEVRSNHGFLIVGIRHTDATTSFNPQPETCLRPGDVVIVLGHDHDIPELAGKFNSKSPQLTYRGAKL